MNEDLVTGPSYNLIPGHKDMSLVSQDFYVLDNHSVEENITDKLVGYTDEYKSKRAAQLLKLLDLVQLKNTKARYLSSGQKQRVAIARALTIMPKLLLLDEPFSNLDNLLTGKLFSFIIKEVKRHKTSVILVTHRAEEALKYADRIAIMDEGKIKQIGDKWDVYYRPQNTKLAGLLGEYNIIKQEDLDKAHRPKLKSKTILRPDQFKLNSVKNGIPLKVNISSCVYNGKCYELLAETESGSSLMIYSGKEIETEKEMTVYILSN